MLSAWTLSLSLSLINSKELTVDDDGREIVDRRRAFEPRENGGRPLIAVRAARDDLRRHRLWWKREEMTHLLHDRLQRLARHARWPGVNILHLTTTCDSEDHRKEAEKERSITHSGNGR